MTKILKMTAIGLSACLILGGVWVASASYHSNQNDEFHATPAVFANAAFAVDFSQAPQSNLLETAKSYLRPIKHYVFGDNTTYFNGVPVVKTCG